MEEMSVLEQIKLLLFLLPFVFLCLACHLVNLSKLYRGRQVLMPILSVLLSIYALFKIQQLYYELYEYLNYAIESSLSGGGNHSEIVEKTAANIVEQMGLSGEQAEAAKEAIEKNLQNAEVSDGLVKLIKQLKDTLGGAFHINLLLSYIINVLCVAAFWIIKCLLLPILKWIWGNNELMRMTVSRFYEKVDVPVSYIDKYFNKNKKKNKKKDNKKKDNNKKNDNEDEDSSEEEKLVPAWFLKPQTPSYRKLLTGVYVGVFVSSILIFLLSLYHPDWAAFKAPFYPVFIILIFGEVVAFLNGESYEKEPEKQKVERPKREPLNPSYRDIWDELRSTYPDNMLRRTPDVLDNEEHELPQIDKDLSFLTNSEDENLQTIALYFQRFPEDEIEPSYVEGCVRLLHGESTLFCNPFYEDLGKYLFPPIIYRLLSYKKCLFIIGRDSTAEDFQAWIQKGITDFLGADGLWQTEIMSEEPISFDLGILKFSDIYNLNLLKTNREFFSQVGFVFILEPSRILATGQLALSLIINQLDLEHCDKITYCACDHNCDGLVDTLSHALKTSITNVIATLPGNGVNMQIYWDADSQNMQYKILENVTHYLGIGTEISLVGMKHNVCNDMSASGPGKSVPLQNECWFACDKFPILDMMWIAGQYYQQICQYTGQRIGQQQFTKALSVRSNIWHCPKAKSTYLIVEDEYNNLFEMSRIFSSRSLKEGFVNIISSHYMLRDYMIQYIDLFQSDAKAIPTIVPDYARTERNVVLKLLMMMKSEPLSEDVIRRELQLGGIYLDGETVDANVASAHGAAGSQEEFYRRFCNIVGKHVSDFTDSTEKVDFKRTSKDKTLDDGISVRHDTYYEIREGNNAVSRCLTELQNAYFICEDELSEKHYISAKLYGHVFQCYLPGQFITMDGKYYQVVSISEDKGIVLRRAADHIDRRLYYRQIRDIVLKKWKSDDIMGASVKIEFQSGMKLTIEHGYADYVVKTNGYLECVPYNDVKHARFFELSDIPERKYFYKNILRLKLPEIEDSVVQFKINDILETARVERKAIEDKCRSIDEKAEQVFIQTCAKCNPSKNVENDLHREARFQAACLKRVVRRKALLNRAPCLKLRDVLVQYAAWENNNTDVSNLSEEDKELIVSDIFYHLNDDEVLERVRFTICLLLSEIFKTTYPESWQYIDVVTQTRADLADNLRNANYHFLDNRLHEAFSLVESRKWKEGRYVLEALLKDYPDNIEIRQQLADVYRHLPKPLLNKAAAMDAEVQRLKEKEEYANYCAEQHLQNDISEIFKSEVDENESSEGKEVSSIMESVVLDDSGDTSADECEDSHNVSLSVSKNSESSDDSNDGADTVMDAKGVDFASNETSNDVESEHNDVESEHDDEASDDEVNDAGSEQLNETGVDGKESGSDGSKGAVNNDISSMFSFTDDDLSSDYSEVLPRVTTRANGSIEDLISDYSVQEGESILPADDSNSLDDIETALSVEGTPATDSSELNETVDSSELNETVDSSNVNESKDSCDTTDSSDTIVASDIDDSCENDDSSETAQDEVASEIAGDVAMADAVQPADTSESTDASAPSDSVESTESVNSSDSVVSSEVTDSSEDLNDSDDERDEVHEEEVIRSIKKSRNEQDYIYVIEDSEIDLGLTVSIERYLDRYLEIIYDFLVWHTGKIASAHKKSKIDVDVDINLDNVASMTTESAEEEKKQKKLGLIQRIIQWFKDLFKKEEVEQKADSEVEDTSNEPDTPISEPLQDYFDSCFLKYGDNNFDKALAVKETIAYLGLLGYDANRLDKARAKAEETRQIKDEEAEAIAKKNRESKAESNESIDIR